MTNNKDQNKRHEQLCRQIGIKESRKLRAQKNNLKTIWYGFSMMGLIGWSITIPTLLGAGFGRFLDERFPTDESWTLIFLVTGLVLGCFNAWRWLAKEDRKIREEHEKKDE